MAPATAELFARADQAQAKFHAELARFRELRGESLAILKRMHVVLTDISAMEAKSHKALTSASVHLIRRPG
jgi:hypothetical protein